MANNKFIIYLTDLGDHKAASLFGVSPRTIKSWRLKDRIPRPNQARLITERSALTLNDIYGVAAFVPVREPRRLVTGLVTEQVTEQVTK